MQASTVCKTNSGGSSIKDDGSFKYIVYKQPLSLDRFYLHDVQQVDSQRKYIFGQGLTTKLLKSLLMHSKLATLRSIN